VLQHDAVYHDNIDAADDEFDDDDVYDDDNAVYNVDGGDYDHLLHPVQVLKNHP